MEEALGLQSAQWLWHLMLGGEDTARGHHGQCRAVLLPVRPETLSTPAPQAGSGALAPPPPVALGLGFLPPQLSAPQSVVPGQFSSAHPPAAAVEAEEK